MSGRIDFTMGFSASGAQRKPRPDGSYRIYLLGDFSGRRETVWQQRKIHKIDRDNFEQVMAKITPRVFVDVGGLALSFSSLEDFHPDAWLKKVGIIAELLGLKKQLQNPETAAQAARNIRAFLPAAAGGDSAPAAQADDESTADTLERLLGKRPETPVEATSSVDQWLKDLVAPHVSRDLGPHYQQLIELIDATVGQLLRGILHSPAFKGREALWLATHALLHEEAAERHDCYLVDIAQEELIAAIGGGAAQDFSQKLLQHGQATDAEQDVLLVSDFSFTANDGDDALLAYCAGLAAACGGRLLATIEPSFLQRSSAAGHDATSGVMLAYPRYLLRLPYGDKRDPLEIWVFEECSAIPQPGELLWGNPAFLLARALLRIAADETEATFFGDIPAFSFDQDGEPKLQPAVESVLTETQANALLTQGILPLMGYQHQRGVRLLAVGI